nr:hypothetical protein [Saprospiraceae bacterium]
MLLRFYGTAFVCLLFVFNLFSQSNCKLHIENSSPPSTCYASDGFIEISSSGNILGCNRTVSVFDSNNQLVGSGAGNFTVSGLDSDLYSVIALNECGCDYQTLAVTLDGGNPTPLTPYVDQGNGFFQSNKAYACKGQSIKIGTQSLGFFGFEINGPNGFYSNIPDESSYWVLENITAQNAGTYYISYVNNQGCNSTTAITLDVNTLSLNLGGDLDICVGEEVTLESNVTGISSCAQACEVSENKLLVHWTLDQCNAQGQNNQNSYAEFLPEYPNNGSCISVNASNVYRDNGEHSCTYSYNNTPGMCTPAMNSCDPEEYDDEFAIKFEVTINPEQSGGLSGLSFYEQSPKIWTTTNGSSGVNNYNTKYLIKVYKNDLLIFEQDEIDTEFSWNEESFDFTGFPGFLVDEISTFRFELRGYCVVDKGGNMSGWELDDIKVFGACCNENNDTSITYLWSTGDTTPNITVNDSESTTYYITVSDCKACSIVDSIHVNRLPLPIPSISGDLEICDGESTTLTASGGTSYEWNTGATTASINVSPSTTTNYSVTVTNADGCEASTSATVIVNPLPTPAISGDLEICDGETTTLTASGGTSYVWNTGATTASINVSPNTTT